MKNDFISKTEEQLEKTLLELEENVALVKDLLATIQSSKAKSAKRESTNIKKSANANSGGFSTALINILQQSGKQMKSDEVVRVAENLGLQLTGKTPFPQRVRGELGRLVSEKKIRRVDSGIYAI